MNWVLHECQMTLAVINTYAAQPTNFMYDYLYRLAYDHDNEQYGLTLAASTV